MNIITLTGNLCAHPTDGTGRATYGQMQNGRSFFNSAIAVNMSYKQGDNWVDRTEFFNIRAYAGTADNLNNNFVKGERILITGEMRAEAWEKDGKKGINYYVNVNRVERSHINRPSTEHTMTQPVGQTQPMGQTMAQPVAQTQSVGQTQPMNQAQPYQAPPQGYEDFPFV